METVAGWMKRAIDAREDDAELLKIRGEVKAFALKYPLPSDS
jgi:glycine/serine hydroxymethyltransferase